MQPVSQALTSQHGAKSAAVNQTMTLLTCLYLWVINPTKQPFLPGNAERRRVGSSSCSALCLLSSGCSFGPTNSHGKCGKYLGKGWGSNSTQIHPSEITKDKPGKAENILCIDEILFLLTLPHDRSHVLSWDTSLNQITWIFPSGKCPFYQHS